MLYRMVTNVKFVMKSGAELAKLAADENWEELDRVIDSLEIEVCDASDPRPYLDVEIARLFNELARRHSAQHIVRYAQKLLPIVTQAEDYNSVLVFVDKASVALTDEARALLDKFERFAEDAKCAFDSKEFDGQMLADFTSEREEITVIFRGRSLYFCYHGIEYRVFFLDN